MGLFWFPDNVNGVNARFVAVQVVAVSILGIIFRYHEIMRYAIAAMCADFILRVVAGGRASMQGSLAEIPSFFFAKKVVPGPPKQFAALCGVMFSGLATLFLFLGGERDEREEGFFIAGAVVLGMLTFAAFLEAAFGLCVGCVMFGFAVRFGIVPACVMDLSSDTYKEIKKALDEEGSAWDWALQRKPKQRTRFHLWLKIQNATLGKWIKWFHHPIKKSPQPWEAKYMKMAEQAKEEEAKEQEMQEVDGKAKEGKMKKKKMKDEEGKGKEGDGKKQKKSKGSSSSSNPSSSSADEGSDSKRKSYIQKKKTIDHGDIDDGADDEHEKLVPVKVEGTQWKPRKPFDCKFIYGKYERRRYTPEFTEPEVRELLLGDDGNEKRKSNSVDMKYKLKTDEKEARDFHLVRHVQVTFYGAIMGLTGLAAAWKLCDDVFDTGKAYWITFGVIALVVITIVSVLYLLKCIFYPHRVLKEWDHPVKGNYFSAILLNIIIFAYLCDEQSITLSKVLFWMGAPLSILIGSVCAARWFSVPHYIDSVNPTWMLPVVGNFVASFVAPIVDSEYNEVGWLWYGFAVITFIPLFVITVQRMSFRDQLEDKLLPSVWIYVAATAVGCSSYLNLKASLCSCDPWVGDMYPRILYFATLGLIFVFTVLVLTRFFGKNKFEIGYWGYTFPLASFAIVTLQYHMFIDSKLTKAMAIGSMIMMTWVIGMCFCHTVVAIMKRQIFVPDERWGPMSFMKITHGAMRNALGEIGGRVEDLSSATEEEDTKTIVRLLKTFHLVHEQHMDHEEKVLYPLFDDFFPGLAGQSHYEHERDKEVIHHIVALIQSLNDSDNKDAVIEQIKKEAGKFIGLTLKHLNYEEAHLNPMPRKYIPVKLHRQLTRRMWELTSGEKWNVIIPFVLMNLPLHGQRLRFIRCFKWAMPERAQQVGLIVYNGVPRPVWQRIVRYIPEIRPRGLFGWNRYW